GHGMLDEVLAAQPLLPLMGGGGEVVGPLDLSEVDLGVAGLDQVGQGLEGVGGRGLGRPEREPGQDPTPAIRPRDLLLLLQPTPSLEIPLYAGHLGLPTDYPVEAMPTGQIPRSAAPATRIDPSKLVVARTASRRELDAAAGILDEAAAW